MHRKICPSKPFALTYLIRPATIADLRTPSMVAVGSTCTHGTVFSSSTLVRVADPQPQEGPSGESAGHLRRRCGSSSHRHPRPSVGLRCRIARPHPLQGRGPDANLDVLVREDSPRGAQSPVGLAIGG